MSSINIVRVVYLGLVWAGWFVAGSLAQESTKKAPDAHHESSDPASEFHVAPGETRAQAYDRFVEQKLKGTYPATAARMIGECGGIREGICIDLGCGSGHLDVELAKRTKFQIIGLDIDPDMKPLFEKRMQAAGLDKRVTFVVGDAQKLPFPDDYADVIVSRGMLIFVPDIAKCLREVERVLKPTGVAFLGGRYLYAPQENKITTEKLKEIVSTANVPGAQVIDARGQWVKILGPQAPPAARESQLGPQMLAHRVVADYGVTEGACLLLCTNDGGLEQALRQGLLDVTQLQLTALYPSEDLARAAEARFRAANLAGRVTCVVGDVHALPFAEASFHAVVGVGGVPFWRDRATAFREIYRVLRPDGVGFVGGMYRHMPDARKVSTASLRETAVSTKLPSIRVLDDMGQWVEIRKARDASSPPRP